jgi:hypothetical protein
VKIIRLVMMAGMALMGMVGCVPTSLQPLYTEKDLVFDTTLIGVWSENKDSKETWAFQKADDLGYKLVITDDDGATGRFQVHLLKFGDTQFLDFFPDASEMDEWKRSGYYKMLLQPVHSFLRIDSIDPELHLVPLDLKWLNKLLKENPDALRHRSVGTDEKDPQILVTASTQELQAFIAKHLKTPEAFGDAMVLKRKTSKP